jgi:hypothetical protein
MKKVLLITASLFLGTTICAENDGNGRLYMGFLGGYTHNHLYTSVGYRPSTAYENKDGFAAGVPIKYVVNDWFCLQTEFSVLQKNYKWLHTDYYAFDSTPYQNVKNTYLQLPVMTQFSFGGEQLRGFCALGGFAGYWAGSRIKGMALDLNEMEYAYNEKYAFDKRRDNRIEYGLVFGWGLEYKYENYCTIVLEGRYYYSTSDLQKNYMLGLIPRYNDTYVIQAGVLFNLASFPFVKQK